MNMRIRVSRNFLLSLSMDKLTPQQVAVIFLIAMALIYLATMWWIKRN